MPALEPVETTIFSAPETRWGSADRRDAIPLLVRMLEEGAPAEEILQVCQRPAGMGPGMSMPPTERRN